MKWLTTIKEAAILTVIIFILALAVNALSPAGISLTSCFNSSPEASDCPYPIVNVIEAKQLIDTKQALFVDARSAAQYKAGHIPCALSLPIYNIEDYLFPFLNAVQPDVPIITYCSCITCEDSHLLAEKLTEMGYGNVRIFAGGIAAWEEKGYDVAVE